MNKNHAGIDVAGARAADDAGNRRHAHRRVEALAVADRGDGRAVAEMRDDQLFRHVRLQLVNDRLVRDAVEPVAAHAHREVLFRQRHAGRDFRHGAMEVGIEHGEVGNAGKEAQSLAHDVDGDGRVQRREGGVAVDLVDQFRRDALIFANRRAAAHGAMTDGRGRGKLAGVERVGDQLECDRTVGQRGRLVEELLALAILHPELAEVGADAIDGAFEDLSFSLPSPAS